MDEFNIALTEEEINDINAFEKAGESIVMTAVDGKLKTLMGIKDKIRPNVKKI